VERAPRIAAASTRAETVETMPLASLRGVHKRYGKTLALDGVDLDVRPGELLALLGPNGAGKSTAIAIWLGLLEPDAGRARLFAGSPLDIENRRRIGVMMQDVSLTPELRVRELIDLTSRYYADPLPVAATLESTRLTELADRPYGKLSGGQKRQVQFALAICGRPPLLFLDEPTVGLDIEARETLWRTIRAMLAGGCSVVLTTHYLEEAEALASRVAVLADGRLIASGSVDDVRSIVSRTEISCSSDLGEEDVRAWPDVVAVARDADRLRITAVAAESVVRRLLAADVAVRHLQVRPAGLADAFAALTKEVA
jgi:ABC-type multidrug transport system ATPase subunit